MPLSEICKAIAFLTRALQDVELVTEGTAERGDRRNREGDEGILSLSDRKGGHNSRTESCNQGCAQ